jgi:uncharacterized membrane protein YfhO
VSDVEITSYTDTHAELAANGPGTLVLADSYYPGWVARVDGVEAPILRADLILRGVTLPPGAHTVTFTYEPGLIGWLTGIGALTLLGALAVPLVALRRRGEAARG